MPSTAVSITLAVFAGSIAIAGMAENGGPLFYACATVGIITLCGAIVLYFLERKSMDDSSKKNPPLRKTAGVVFGPGSRGGKSEGNLIVGFDVGIEDHGKDNEHKTNKILDR